MYASKDFLGLNVIKKYYNQLQFLSNRFPMKQSEPCETEFSWDDLYHEKEIVISVYVISIIGKTKIIRNRKVTRDGIK